MAPRIPPMMGTKTLAPLARTVFHLPTRRNIHVINHTPLLRHLRLQLLRQPSRSVGLVPTMGALHRGHLALIRAAARENTDVFVSVYVNPTQFGVHEDLASYPKTWDSDLKMLEALDQELAAEAAATERARQVEAVSEVVKGKGKSKNRHGRITAVFAPSTKTMYPSDPPSSIPGEAARGTFVTLQPLQQLLEGRSRPVFFRGVATVCAKLFNLVMPERVYFGQKDVQQTVVIKKMVKDLGFGMGGMEVRVCGTEREEDGLALSSRNVYLGARRRSVGVVLHRALRVAEEKAKGGMRERKRLLSAALEVVRMVQGMQAEMDEVEKVRFEVDYLSVADPDTLEEVEMVDLERGAVLSGAIKMLPLEKVKFGEKLGLGDDKVTVRLIDNIVLEPRT